MKPSLKKAFGLFIIIVIFIGAVYRFKGILPISQSIFTKKVKLVHVAVGFTEPFFLEYDKWFTKKWKRDTDQTVVIEHSYGPSGVQSIKVIEGKLHPDILTLSNPSEIDAIVKTGLVASDWRNAFPYASSPFYSDVVFLVRRGNPKGIRDWKDLTQPDISLVFSNPKTCGGGRWVYTAALGAYSIKSSNNDETKSKNYLSRFLKNIPTVYANQNESGDAFLKEGKGDVLITYENLALAAANEPDAQVELVVPSQTVAIDMPIAMVNKIAEQNKTTEVATAYLQGLYDPKVQELLAKYFIHPRLQEVAKRTTKSFPKVTLFKREDVFKTEDVENEHLKDGGIFDSLFNKNTKQNSLNITIQK